MCPACEELHVDVDIPSPDELAKAIRVAKSNVADGTLQVELPSGVTETAQQPFSELRTDGPWGDFVAYTFRCAKCGARFALSAETSRKWWIMGSANHASAAQLAVAPDATPFIILARAILRTVRFAPVNRRAVRRRAPIWT